MFNNLKQVIRHFIHSFIIEISRLITMQVLFCVWAGMIVMAWIRVCSSELPLSGWTVLYPLSRLSVAMQSWLLLITPGWSDRTPVWWVRVVGDETTHSRDGHRVNTAHGDSMRLPWLLGDKDSACQCRSHRKPGFDPWIRKKGMATHSSILAWEIPWTEEHGGLQSMRSQRVGYDLLTKQQ